MYSKEDPAVLIRSEGVYFSLIGEKLPLWHLANLKKVFFRVCEHLLLNQPSGNGDELKDLRSPTIEVVASPLCPTEAASTQPVSPEGRFLDDGEGEAGEDLEVTTVIQVYTGKTKLFFLGDQPSFRLRVWKRKVREATRRKRK